MNITLLERFERKIFFASPDGCWYWTAGVNTGGYGRIFIKKIGGKKERMLAHRLSFLLYKGEISQGLLVCHSCDNPLCVNPDHLFLGTQLDNVRDRDNKGRRPAPIGSKNNSAKINEYDVLEIRNMRSQKISYKEISDRYGLSVVTIKNICSNRTWKHVI